MLSKVTYTINTTGLGRTTPSADGVTGFPFLNDNVADLTGFSATNRIEKFLTIKEVEATGITSDSTNFAYEWYVANEFFRLGGGILYIGIFATTTTISEAIDAMSAYTQGEIRVYGYGEANELSSALVSTLNTKMASLQNAKKPALGVIGAYTGSVELADFLDLRNLASESPLVSVVTGVSGVRAEDGGKFLIGNYGAYCGAISSSDVATNPLYVARFNYASAGEMESPAIVYSDGVDDDLILYASDSAFTETLGDTLNDKGHVFYRYLPNVAGTYLSNSHTASVISSDLYNVPNVRTMGKVIRETDSVFSTYLGSKIHFDNKGKLSKAFCSSLETAGNSVLKVMVDSNELSAGQCFVSPDQTTISTGIIEINVRMIPIGSADVINVQLQFTTTI